MALPAQGVTKEVLLDAIRAAAAGSAGGTPITATLPLHLVAAGLTRADLDAISHTRPIRIAPLGGHSGLLNTAALRAWGIADDAKDPLGGWYGRGGDGRLDGWLRGHREDQHARHLREHISCGIGRCPAHDPVISVPSVSLW